MQLNNYRIQIYKVSIYGFLSLLLLFLFQIQVIRAGHYRRISEHNRIRLVRVTAPRGEILDRNNKPFATSRSSYNVAVIPEDFDPKDLPTLSKMLDLSPADIRKQLSSVRSKSLMPVILKKDVGKDLAIQIAEKSPLLSGIFIDVEGVRYYPERETSAHVVGYIGKITDAEYRTFDHDVYAINSDIGRVGIEKSFDSLLRGEDGGKQIEVNARGEQLSILSEKKPISGADVRLSLDIELESKILPILGEKTGVVLMMDLETGEILAMLSNPSFDPNVFIEAGRDRDRVKLMKNMHRPLINRSVVSAYPPGSVFKLVTAMAGLETGKITPHTTFNCPGYFQLNSKSRRFKCWESLGHGNVNLFGALERSCNVFFYNIGRLVGEKNLARYSYLLGLGMPIPLEIPASDGFIPSAEWKEHKPGQHWYEGETVTFAIGQGYVQTTPLQILRLVSIIAKDGQIPKPTLLKQNSPPDDLDRIHVKSSTLKAIRQGMLNVTESKYGTGQLARVDFMRLAAKTGTAQAPPRLAHAWFAGFFPYEKPKIALVVFVEHGGSGGLVAASLAKKIVMAWHELYSPVEEYIKPTLPPVTI